MSSGLGRVCLFCVLICYCCAYSWPEQENPSVYEALEQYNLPVGLLPEGVTGYDLNPSTGEFSAYLKGSCEFTLANSFRLKYESSISGVISTGRLGKVRGVRVKLVRLWLRIKEVRREGENLVFYVGFSSANFPMKYFMESPKCGCGFSCNVTADDHHHGIRLNSANSLSVFMNI